MDIPILMSYDDFIYIIEDHIPKKSLKFIKREFKKRGYDEEPMECEITFHYTEREKRLIKRIEPWENVVKFKFEETEITNAFETFHIYNTSSVLAGLVCCNIVYPESEDESVVGVVAESEKV